MEYMGCVLQCTGCILVYSLYTSMLPVLQCPARTPVYSPYTSIQPVHQYTVRTPVYSPYTGIQPIHQYTVRTPVYSPYTSIQPLSPDDVIHQRERYAGIQVTSTAVTCKRPLKPSNATAQLSHQSTLWKTIVNQSISLVLVYNVQLSSLVQFVSLCFHGELP